MRSLNSHLEAVSGEIIITLMSTRNEDKMHINRKLLFPQRGAGTGKTLTLQLLRICVETEGHIVLIIAKTSITAFLYEEENPRSRSPSTWNL